MTRHRKAATVADTPKIFRATSWPRERFYLSRDQRRSASVVPHSWESDEPVADAVRERWRIHKQTHHGTPLNPHAEATSRRFLASLMRKVTEDIEAQQRQKAFEAGYKKGRDEASKLSDHSAYGRLLEKVTTFEAASGINIETDWSLERIGRAAKLIRNVGIEHVVRSLESQSALCRRAVGEIEAALVELRAEVAPLQERAS